MTARMVYSDRMSSVSVTLPEHPVITQHEGLDQQQYVDIHWNCTTIKMSRQEAIELWGVLGSAIYPNKSQS